jgi:hypothetical protein
MSRRVWIVAGLVLLVSLLIAPGAFAMGVDLRDSASFYVFVLNSDQLFFFAWFDGYNTQQAAGLLPTMCLYGVLTGVLGGLIARGIAGAAE